MRNKKFMSILTIIVCIMLIFSVNSSAFYIKNINNEPIVDESGFISPANKKIISEALINATEKTKIEFRVFVYDYNVENNLIDMYDYEDMVGEHFSDLVLLIVSYEYGEYYYELFTKGAANEKISDKEADKILDNKEVYESIKSGDLTGGILKYISLAKTAVSGTLRNSFADVFLPSLVISLSVAAIAVIAVYAVYKRKQHSPSYPLEKYARLDLNVSHDTFVTKTVSRVRVSDSSSGTSSRSGSSGGGGSRGKR